MKARLKNRLIFSFQVVFVACLIILNPSCGLDEYYILNGPSSVHVPVDNGSNTIQFPERYFEFTTNENSSYNNSGLTFQGTAVYYKIYSNLSTCESEYKALNTMANSDTSKANSASSMINSYKFQQMKNLYSNNDVLIPHNSGTDVQNVKIRLTKYTETDNSDNYSYGSDVGQQPYLVPFIAIENKKVGIPVRYYGGRRFDFNRHDTAKGFIANIPRTTYYEDDVSSNTSVSKENVWYITLYAVGQGYDSSFTTYYSNIVHLGTLAIYANSYDN